MRNQYPGECYRCGEHVAAGEGHFERFGHSWRVQHAACAITHRGTPDPARQALSLAHMKARALETGKRGQRARRELARMLPAPINIRDF